MPLLNTKLVKLAQRYIRAKARNLTFKRHFANANYQADNTKERLESNPFYHKFSLTRKQWCLTAVGCLSILPVRLILVAGLCVGLWMPYSLMISRHLLPKSTVTPGEIYFWRCFFGALYRVCGVWPSNEGNAIVQFAEILCPSNVPK